MGLKALILVDLQNDFCEGGNLAVPGGDEVIILANQLQNVFDIVIASKDWHPADHMSFASNHPDAKIGDMLVVNNLSQVLWPDHCVQESVGAQFHPQLETQAVTKIIYKGTDKTVDSYSAFFDNAHLRATGLMDYLEQENVEDIYILGLATDYCVKFTCLDGVLLGFNVHVIVDGCRGVNLKAGDVQLALDHMKSVGVQLIHSETLLSEGV